MVLEDHNKGRMWVELHDLALMELRTPVNGSTDAANYVNKLLDRVVKAKELLTHLAMRHVAQEAIKKWKRAFSHDARVEGWDIVLTERNFFKEFIVVDARTGLMTATVLANLRDGPKDYHSAAREFLYAYSYPIFELMKTI